MKLFKDYYTTNTISLTTYGLAAQLIDVYSNNNLPIMGEVQVQSLSHSSLDYFAANENGCIQALYYLNAKTEAIRKTLTIWDAYQIRGTLQDRDTILSQLTQLPPNSSLVSNLEQPFSWIDKNQKTITVHKGDIFIKDNNEEIHHIQSLSSGYYAPTSIEAVNGGGNNFLIQYHYFSDYPKEGDAPQDYDPETDGAYENIKLQLNQQSEAFGYDLRGEIAPGDFFTFLQQIKNDIIIRPVIKIFNENYEQIFADNSYSYDSTIHRFEITNTLPITILYEVK